MNPAKLGLSSTLAALLLYPASRELFRPLPAKRSYKLRRKKISSNLRFSSEQMELCKMKGFTLQLLKSYMSPAEFLKSRSL